MESKTYFGCKLPEPQCCIAMARARRREEEEGRRKGKMTFQTFNVSGFPPRPEAREG